ncbi:MAG: hypothetical protein A2365_02910 [Candidatus Nealsonbacteria bacterium RIFOXYB1_FULL_40_15]|uniref:Thioredoxin domain-containing protein n=2 Tax=Candidatus Nealsoniibacteriota TaxID=1817911 RepID=A0A1G2ET49_9BACT|nr:MAG: hypothetical protein A2365_02910 [Candidatus Nealsonbacteria bacterium RIFOXYB1_FULL_40_15]OGZ28448.1 MAG: hypothetical protein A2427_02535 [Candidatus Nealsonbacteria bacterium RIFOXYC1_FULL_40_7]OGZ29859.1 MAG: hypothetical protein A2562_01945 [Candidatus Nealsonbacteria bacterium RIFOXYD1_FULL_39_11]
MKKILFCFLLFFLPLFVFAKEATIDFFYSPTCPHCAEEKKFLDQLEKDYPDLVINRYSVAESENIGKLKQYYHDYNVPEYYHGMVPATFTKARYFVGFDGQVAKDIKSCLDDICYKDGVSGDKTTAIDMEGNVRIPFLGTINTKNYSLPLLAVILGSLDGFNVCSLGALVLILGLVLAFKSRKRVLLFGGLFIFTTALIYGLLIVAWYKIFALFVPYMKLMQFLVGVLGIIGGAYFLNAFLKFRKHGPACEVSKIGLISKITLRFQNLFKESGSIVFLLALVLLFAGIITIIEFPCSAVVPVAFAGVLAQAGLSTFQYIAYISIFVLFYMLDEIIVFLIAFFSMKIWLASSKVVTWAALAEAVILFILGAYYLFNLI